MRVHLLVSLMLARFSQADNRVVLDAYSHEYFRVLIERNDGLNIQGVTLYLEFVADASVQVYPMSDTVPGFYGVRDTSGRLVMQTSRPFDISVPGMGFID